MNQFAGTHRLLHPSARSRIEHSRIQCVRDERITRSEGGTGCVSVNAYIFAAMALCLASLPWAAAHAGLTRPSRADPDVRLTGISANLGLADVEVDSPPTSGCSYIARWRPLGGPQSPWMRGGELVQSVRVTEGAIRTVWRVRLSLGIVTGSEVEVAVDEIDATGREVKTLPAARGSIDPGEDQRTPDWAKGTVWYQVFPERFRNGNHGNDPTAARDLRCFHMPWTSAWTKVSEDELAAAQNRRAAMPRAQGLNPRQPGGLLYSVIFSRRYGGDLQGVQQQLDHLHRLGIDALYLTPVFRAASLHKYDAADYRHIDDTLGDPTDAPPNHWHEPGETDDPSTWTWTRADRYVLEDLIPAVHARGMRIIFDGVWNHTGREHWVFQSLQRDGILSPYASWLNAEFVPDPKPAPADADDGLNWLAPGNLMSWKSWGDHRNGNLPAFRQTPERDLVPPVKRHIFDITDRWLRPERQAPSPPLAAPQGIDGWRLDVAPDIGVAFWRGWRRHVKSLNPDALLIGEVWYPATAFFNGNGFDGQMNYPFAVAVVGWLGQRPGMTSTALAAELDERVLLHHPATQLVQMNLLESHDTDRLASMLFNPGRAYDAGGTQTGRYKNTRPPDDIYDLCVLAAAIQTAYVGSPMVYYGSEIGMWGGDDPDNRKPMPWPDVGPMADPADAPMEGLYKRYAGWLTLRRRADLGPLLRFGALRHLNSGSPDVFAFERRLGDGVATLVVNRGSGPVEISTLLSNDCVLVHGPDVNRTTLPARRAGLWLSRPPSP